MKTALELAQEHRFFHWPLEFAEVFTNGGFDVVLGNPPWKVLQINRDQLTTAPDADAARRDIEASLAFIRGSERCPLTSIGKLNLYALFAELGLRVISPRGRAGLVVQRGIATDEPNKAFFDFITSRKHLVSLLDFVNSEGVFPIHRSFNFCLLTLGHKSEHSELVFFATRPEHLADIRRHFALSDSGIALINPNTKTCPIFRTDADAELTRTIYHRIPVLIQEEIGSEVSPWNVSVQLNFFSTANAHDRTLFRDPSASGMDGQNFCPVYRGAMVHQFNHRFGTFVTEHGDFRDTSELEKADPNLVVVSDKYVPRAEVEARLRRKGWIRHWMLGWRDFCRSTDERTLIAAALPVAGADDTFSLLFPKIDTVSASAMLLGNLNSLVLDYIVQQKVGGTHIRKYVLAQLPVLPPSSYKASDHLALVWRVVELTYTSWDMQPFARDLGYEREPFRWDPERRAQLRAELDAYYAYLYGLSKKELRYILDPKDVMGEDYPSETFRVLKDNETKRYGEYRTQRLVLEAYDRFAKDGTFDPARLEDPEYFPVVRAALRGAQDELKKLVTRANQEPQPVLFVEGASDAPIVEAAWRALFPGEPMPFTILAAGGTDSMRSLAGKGGALKMALDKTILALADNDGAGRALSDGNDFKKLKAGGTWGQLENGIWWCLLAPGAELRQVMERFKIPETNWPCTVEQCFSAVLRRQAAADGAYAVSRKLFSDLLVGLKDERTDPLWELDRDDDAYWYVRAPHPDCKERFASWIADRARLTRENFAGFDVVLSGLKDVLAQHRADKQHSPQRQRMA